MATQALSDSALSVPFNSTGSILCKRSMSDWNKVLTSSCTAVACTVESAVPAACPKGFSGEMNSTDLAPKMVLPAI